MRIPWSCAACVCLIVSGLCMHAQQTNLSAACQKTDFSQVGQPAMFGPRDGVAFGISSKKHAFTASEDIVLTVWIDNETSSPKDFFSCSMLWDWNVDVWDEDGVRLVSRLEMQEREQPGVPLICARNIAFKVPPFTCMSTKGIVVLSGEYNLRPGTYSVTGKWLEKQSLVDSPSRPPIPGEALIITLEKTK
jgi:hypothetical protein